VSEKNAKAGRRPFRAPLVDVFETADGVVMQVELPGVEKDAAKVTLEGDTLRVETSGETREAPAGEAVLAEFVRADFAREFALSRDLDREHIEASWSSGVLKLRIPKLAAAGPRKIQIRTDESA